MLVAAIQMVNPVNDGFAIRHQAGNHQAGRGAQVGGHHRGARQARHAGDDGGVALGGDVGAHAVQLGHVHEAVFKNGFGDAAGPFGQGVQGHELRLHIGGEGRVGQGAHIHRFRAALHVQRNPVVAGFHHAAGFHQLVQHGFHAGGVGAAQHHMALGDGGGHQEGAGFDAVWHHCVFGAVQALDAFDHQAVAADAADLGAHFHQALGQVGDFRLARGVFQNGDALGQGGGHQQVFGAGDGDHVHHHARALELAARLDVAMLDDNIRPHRRQALDVLIHRPAANRATARQRHTGLAKARQRRAQHQNRGAHGFHQLIRRLQGVDVAGGEFVFVDIVGHHPRAHALQQLLRGQHIAQLRHIGQPQGVGGQQAGAQNRQRRIFGARHGDVAVQRAIADNFQFFHDFNSAFTKGAGAK